jgi:hypothetical protein
VDPLAVISVLRDMLVIKWVGDVQSVNLIIIKIRLGKNTVSHVLKDMVHSILDKSSVLFVPRANIRLRVRDVSNVLKVIIRIKVDRNFARSVL